MRPRSEPDDYPFKYQLENDMRRMPRYSVSTNSTPSNGFLADNAQKAKYSTLKYFPNLAPFNEILFLLSLLTRKHYFRITGEFLHNLNSTKVVWFRLGDWLSVVRSILFRRKVTWWASVNFEGQHLLYRFEEVYVEHLCHTYTWKCLISQWLMITLLNQLW